MAPALCNRSAGCFARSTGRNKLHDGQVSHDEGGYRQLIDAYGSMVVYWIQHMGQADPSKSALQFEDFKAWLAKRIEEHKLFALVAFQKSLRQKAVCGSRAKLLFNVLGECFQHPGKALRLTREHLWGSPLPRQLAREWVRATTGRRSICSPVSDLHRD